MAPFPETEIMTIKRLEVALRKADYKLLKDGAYKLHEKFHGGHRFEYIDLLKEILNNVSNNSLVPEDVKGILIPTILDILDSMGIQVEHSDVARQRVSSLTSLSYTIPPTPKSTVEYNENEFQQEINSQEVSEETYEKVASEINQEQVNDVIEQTQEEKINAFSAFGSAYSNNNSLYQTQTYVQSPVNQQPFKEFTNPIATNLQTTTYNQEPVVQEKSIDVQNAMEPEIEKVPSELKSIAIFYNQNSSVEKNKNITILREEISKINNKDVSLSKILDLISEINIQTNTDVSALQSILEQLRFKDNRISLITNTQSSKLTKLLQDTDANYSLLMPEDGKNFNLIPLLGLFNLYICSECGEEYLNCNEEITPLVLQCPKCKKAMFSSLYATKGVNSEINLNYYNATMLSLVNSKVWVLINPSQDDKFSINILRTALRMSNSVQEIYILDKDINVKEQYKNMFFEINDAVKVDIQTTALEEFLKTIK